MKLKESYILSEMNKEAAADFAIKEFSELQSKWENLIEDEEFKKSLSSAINRLKQITGEIK